jgi:ribosome recycling factor
MAYSFERFQTQLNDIQKRLASELSSVRTGRVNPALLDGVYVEAYGGRLPLKQFGSITVEDARTLKITLWDRSQFKNVEAAVQKANLGVTVLTAPDGISLRLLFPELTEEKRKLLTKLIHTQVEAARASLRQEREKVWHDIQVKERNGEISEDDKFKLKDELQKIVDGGNKKFAEMGQRKEAEILN